MILCDKSIQQAIKTGRLKINPFSPEQILEISPCTIDVHLGKYIQEFVESPKALDSTVKLDDPDVGGLLKKITKRVNIPTDGYTLKPQQFILANTLETITMPSDLVALLEGRSTLARYGITVHGTAPIIHPTFSGTIVLEMYNAGTYPCLLKSGMSIGQLMFAQLDKKPAGTLNSVWQHQSIKSLKSSK